MHTPGGRRPEAGGHRAGVWWRGLLLSLVVPGLGAATFVVLLALAYGTPIVVDMERAQQSVTRGFHPAERGDDGLRWAWTGRRAELILNGLDRRTGWRWTAEAIVWRPADVPRPHLTIAVDGVIVAGTLVSEDFQPLEADVPPRPGATGLVLTIDTDPVFVPSAGDPRELGVAVTSMLLEPAGRPAVPRRALAGGALAMAGLGAALVLLRLPLAAALGLILIAASVQAWTTTQGYAVYLSYPQTAAIVTTSFGFGAFVLLRVVERVRGAPAGAMARTALGLSVTAACLKLLILLHPTMPIGDGMFHAHRFQNVLRGDLYFTSIAPGEYAFPYPILLYVAAAPFAFWTADTFEQIALLRIVVTAADAAAAMMLYWMVVRTLADTRIALAAVLWYHLLPATAWIMTWGNLTNAFAQAWFVASLALIAGLTPDGWRPRAVILLTGVAAIALLSHPNVCAILVMAMAVTALLYRRYGGPVLAGASRGLWQATLGAAGLALVAYYAWFALVYVREFGRIASEVAVNFAEPGTSLPRRAVWTVESVPRFFGWPGMMAAFVGLAAWDRFPARLRLLLVGWGAVCVAFAGLGLLSPIMLRSHYAAFPAVALLAACGSVGAWDGPRPLRWCAVALLAAAAWIGIRVWAGLVE